MADFTGIFERQCAICKKMLYPTPGWVYKIPGKEGNKIRWYCSYTCWRKDGGGSGPTISKFAQYY